MSIRKIWTKIQRMWTKFRLQPIHVYCFHHVSVVFDADSMNRGDWVQIDEFKSKMLALQRDGVEFISLTDAYRRICNDCIRCKKYAVLTFDDGYASLKEILPWLEEQLIPATLFINGKYLDGKSYRKDPKEKYLTQNEILAITSPLIEIGSHGWEHTDASQMNEFEFVEYMDRNIRLLSSHPRYVSFHAYTWGKHTSVTDNILLDRTLIPVLMDGIVNYNELHVIHRELLKIK